MMEKYPAGRFFILSGLGMFVATAFVSIGWNPLEKRLGENVVPYLVFVLLGILLFAMFSLYKKLKPNIAVILGAIGWAGTLLLLYLHYSQDTLK